MAGRELVNDPERRQAGDLHLSSAAMTDTPSYLVRGFIRVVSSSSFLGGSPVPPGEKIHTSGRICFVLLASASCEYSGLLPNGIAKLQRPLRVWDLPTLDPLLLGPSPAKCLNGKGGYAAGTAKLRLENSIVA